MYTVDEFKAELLGWLAQYGVKWLDIRVVSTLGYIDIDWEIMVLTADQKKLGKRYKMQSMTEIDESTADAIILEFKTRLDVEWMKKVGNDASGN